MILLELKKGEIFMTVSKSLRKIQSGPIRHRLSTEFIEKNGTLCASSRVKAEFYVITDTINRLIDGKFGLKDSYKLPHWRLVSVKTKRSKIDYLEHFMIYSNAYFSPLFSINL